MSRQLRTLIIGAVLCLLLAASTLFISVPYVILSPGLTCNTLDTCTETGSTGPIITVKGTSSRVTTGHLNLTTVSVNTSRTTAAQAIIGWLKSDQVVVPHDSVYPPGQSQTQVNQAEQQQFTSSQNSAVAAAACELGFPRGFGIVSVASNSVNLATLKAGDQFVSVGGKPVTDSDSLKAALTGLDAGQATSAVIKRAGTQLTVSLKLGPPSAGSTTPLLGIEVSQTCLMPFEVDLSLGGIGGPSAGLMFALGVMDKVGSVDLTHGRFIAGTGTIDNSGAVGAIGGIQLKMIGARRAGATIFLAPQSNCSDVKGNIPSGLNVVAVTTLHDAVTDLAAIAAGTSVAHC